MNRMKGEGAYDWYSHMASWHSDDTEKMEPRWLALSDAGDSSRPPTPNSSGGGVNRRRRKLKKKACSESS